MARYIDADIEVSNYVTVWDCDCSEFGRQTVMAVDDLKYLPSADVLPKSDFEGLRVDYAILEQTCGKIKADNTNLAAEVDTLHEFLDAAIAGQKTLQEYLANVRAEVAREIFEEIEGNACSINAIDCRGIVVEKTYKISSEMIAELKKKYTEVKNE